MDQQIIYMAFLSKLYRAFSNSMIHNVKKPLGTKGNTSQTFVDRPPKTGIMAIREDPDEMPQNVAFHQGLHCLLETKSIF